MDGSSGPGAPPPAAEQTPPATPPEGLPVDQATANTVVVMREIRAAFADIRPLVEAGMSSGHARTIVAQIIQAGMLTIIIIAAVVLALFKVMTTDIALLLGSIVGYLFGRGVGNFDAQQRDRRE